jgi:hypothetical protein
MLDIDENKNYIVNGKELLSFLDGLENFNLTLTISKFKFGILASVRDSDNNEDAQNLILYEGEKEEVIEIAPEHDEECRTYLGSINNGKMIKFLTNKSKNYEVHIVGEKAEAIKNIRINHTDKRIYLS